MWADRFGQPSATSEAFHCLGCRHGPKTGGRANTLAMRFTMADQALTRCPRRYVRRLGWRLVISAASPHCPWKGGLTLIGLKI